MNLASRPQQDGYFEILLIVFHLLLSAIFPNEVVFLALTLGLLVNWRIVRQAEDKLTLPPMMISWSKHCRLHSSCRDPCLTAQRKPGIHCPSWLDWGLSTRAYPSVSRNMSEAWDRKTTCQSRVYQNLKCFLYRTLSLFPSCKSLNSFFFLLSLVVLLKQKQTEQAPSWKQNSILALTVDFELYAQYFWKRDTSWKTRPSQMEEPHGST